MCGWEENRWREKHLELLAYAENGHTSLLELEWTVHEAWDSCRIASLPWHTYCMCSKWLEKNWNVKPGISVQSLYMKLKQTNRHYIQSCQPQNHGRIFTHWYYQLVCKRRTLPNASWVARLWKQACLKLQGVLEVRPQVTQTYTANALSSGQFSLYYSFSCAVLNVPDTICSWQ